MGNKQQQELSGLVGAVVCMLAALWVQLFADASNGWQLSALWYH